MEVHFGSYAIKTSEENDQKLIYDIIRKKWVVRNSEEEVRQIWLHYLVDNMKMPLSRIAVERGYKIHGRIRRFDICVYDKYLNPNLLIECKAPQRPLVMKNLEQLSIYNFELNCKYFILTNGLQHLGWQVESSKIESIHSPFDIEL